MKRAILTDIKVSIPPDVLTIFENARRNFRDKNTKKLKATDNIDRHIEGIFRDL